MHGSTQNENYLKKDKIKEICNIDYPGEMIRIVVSFILSMTTNLNPDIFSMNNEFQTCDFSHERH